MSQHHPRLGAESFPLSAAQRAVLAGGGTNAVRSVRWDLRGELRADVLEAAILAVIERHEILRTGFSKDSGTWRQTVAASARFRLGQVDIRALPIDDHAVRTDAIARELAADPFDLVAPPLLRATLVRTAPERATLLMAVHEAVFDAPSARIFAQEIETIVAAGPFAASRLPGLSLQFADYALWEEDCNSSPAHAEDLAFWTRQIAACPTREAGSDARDLADPQRLIWPLAPRFAERIAEAATELDATPLDFGCAAVSRALPGMRAGMDGACFTPVDGRAEAALAPLIGPFASRLLVRVPAADSDTPLTRLRSARSAVAAAMARSPEALSQALAQEGDRGAACLPRVSLAVERDARPQPNLAVSLTVVPGVPAAGPSEISIILRLASTRSALVIDFDAARYTGAQIISLGQAIASGLDGLMGKPAADHSVAGALLAAQAQPANSAEPIPAPRTTAPNTARPTWEIVLMKDGRAGGPVIVTVNQPFLYRNFAGCFGPDRTIVNLMVPDRASLDRQKALGYEPSLDEAATLLAQRFAGRTIVFMGQCIDGMTALHLARRLEDGGIPVCFVAMIDSWAPLYTKREPSLVDRLRRLGTSRRRWQHYLGQVWQGRLGLKGLALRSGIGRRLVARLGRSPTEAAGAGLIVAVNKHHAHVGHRTHCPGWDGEVITFASDSTPRHALRTLFEWDGLLPADTPIHRVAGWHEDALLHHSFARIAEVIDTRLERRLRHAVQPAPGESGGTEPRLAHP